PILLAFIAGSSAPHALFVPGHGVAFRFIRRYPYPTFCNFSEFRTMASLHDHPLRVREEMLNHPTGNLVPIVVEKSGRGERSYDIFSRLLKDRIIMFAGGVDDMEANVIIAQLLFLSNEDNKADINFYINSPGGSV